VWSSLVTGDCVSPPMLLSPVYTNTVLAGHCHICCAVRDQLAVRCNLVVDVVVVYVSCLMKAMAYVEEVWALVGVSPPRPSLRPSPLFPPLSHPLSPSPLSRGWLVDRGALQNVVCDASPQPLAESGHPRILLQFDVQLKHISRY